MFKFCSTFLLLTFTAVLQAGPVVSLVGDNDCFGLGGACPDGSLYRDLGGTFVDDFRSGDPVFTDFWSEDIQPGWTHTYSLGSETALSASLVVRTAGIADDRGPWDVFFNGTNVGQFTVNSNANNFEEVQTFTFVIPIGLLTGSDVVTTGINFPSLVDGYDIDFAELTINTDNAAVPEPGSLVLLSLGFGAIGLIRRKRSR